MAKQIKQLTASMGYFFKRNNGIVSTLHHVVLENFLIQIL